LTLTGKTIYSGAFSTFSTFSTFSIFSAAFTTTIGYFGILLAFSIAHGPHFSSYTT
jgi:hypothetical protein